ncbi:MAG: sialate O-acetylesterase [Clostridia bacterium]
MKKPSDFEACERERKKFMEYGVTLQWGVKPWQIFQQRPDGTACIAFGGKYTRVHLSPDVPISFTRVEKGAVTIKARIALESTGESIIPWTCAETMDEISWRIQFDNVPAGGLYRVETYMEYEGWDGLSVTRGDMAHNIGVGDVFVIAGQSNAAGRAKNPVEDQPELGIHMLRCSGVWDLATHPLGETTGSEHLGHFENHNPGHSPWLHFAKRLKAELGYPIGLVNCAYGGAPLKWWNKEENGALTDNMLAMLDEYAITPKAVLWIQGEAEGYENAGDTYLPRFSALVAQIRKQLSSAKLPFLTVQLNRCVNESTLVLDRQWGMVRQAQRDAMKALSNVWVVPSNDVSLYDFIHDSAQGNLVLGERVARMALCEMYGKKYDWKAPEAESAVQTAPDTVELCFSRIRNWLNPFDVPPARLPIEAEDALGFAKAVAYEVHQASLTLHFERPLQKNASLHGAWRMDSGAYVPCDCMRMPMLSFYGLPITE